MDKYKTPSAEPAATASVAGLAQPVGAPKEWTPVETIRYWLNAYSDRASGPHFMGHGMVVHLLREYLSMREAAAQPTAPSAPTVQPLTEETISAVQRRHNAAYHAGDVFSPQDFARNIERECAAAWGITLAGITAAPTNTPTTKGN